MYRATDTPIFRKYLLDAMTPRGCTSTTDSTVKQNRPLLDSVAQILHHLIFAVTVKASFISVIFGYIDEIGPCRVFSSYLVKRNRPIRVSLLITTVQLSFNNDKLPVTETHDSRCSACLVLYFTNGFK